MIARNHNMLRVSEVISNAIKWLYVLSNKVCSTHSLLSVKGSLAVKNYSNILNKHIPIYGETVSYQQDV